MNREIQKVLEGAICDFVYNPGFKLSLIKLLETATSALIFHRERVFGFYEFTQIHGTDLRKPTLPDHSKKSGNTDALLAIFLQFYLNQNVSAKLVTYDFTINDDDVIQFNPTTSGEVEGFLRSVLGQPSAFCISRSDGIHSIMDTYIGCVTIYDGDAWLVLS